MHSQNCAGSAGFSSSQEEVCTPLHSYGGGFGFEGLGGFWRGTTGTGGEGEREEEEGERVTHEGSVGEEI